MLLFLILQRDRGNKSNEIDAAERRQVQKKVLNHFLDFFCLPKAFQFIYRYIILDVREGAPQH